MVWESPPPVITELRTMLLACASAVAAGYVESSVHYPASALTADGGAEADTLPIADLAPEINTRIRYAEMGVAPLTGGTLLITLWAQISTGAMDALADAICAELLQQSTGLPVIDCTHGRCSDPRPGARAAATDGDEHANADVVGCTLTLTYGLQP